jgi:hypothetical protein
LNFTFGEKMERTFVTLALENNSMLTTLRASRVSTANAEEGDARTLWFFRK